MKLTPVFAFSIVIFLSTNVLNAQETSNENSPEFTLNQLETAIGVALD